MKELNIKDLPEIMILESMKLKEGPIVFAYDDNGNIRMETEHGEDPFVWRRDHWQRMIEQP